MKECGEELFMLCVDPGESRAVTAALHICEKVKLFLYKMLPLPALPLHPW